MAAKTSKKTTVKATAAKDYKDVLNALKTGVKKKMAKKKAPSKQYVDFSEGDLLLVRGEDIVEVVDVTRSGLVIVKAFFSLSEYECDLPTNPFVVNCEDILGVLPSDIRLGCNFTFRPVNWA